MLKYNNDFRGIKVKKYKEYWLKLSIKRKLLTYFFIISFVGAVVNLYLHTNNYKIMNEFNRNLMSYYMVNELLVEIRNNQVFAEDYLKNLNTESENKFIQTKDEIYRLIGELDEEFSSMESTFSINAIKYSSESYLSQWSNAIELRKNKESKYFIDYYDGMKIYHYTEKYVQDLLYIALDEGARFYNDLAEEYEAIRTLSLILIFITFTLSLFFGGIFSNYIVAPIKKLAESSAAIAKGKLDVDLLEVKSRDEVGILTDSFNHMSKSIRALVNSLKQKALIEKKLHEEEIELIKTQQLLQEAEFLALQSQINPHFLFNTLNTISRTAMFENAHDTSKLIIALSNIFRFSLRNTGKFISLKDELDVIEQYIYIQKFRFDERLNFDIQCYMDISDIYLPALLIQPLVENAIVHGIEPKIQGGRVRIKIYKNDFATYIKVMDTGIGMTKEKIREILSEQEQKSKNRKSIGIKNVYHRFRQFFNDESQFIIQSKLGVGTIITMVIPNEFRGRENV